jgi:hypothetical protein
MNLKPCPLCDSEITHFTYYTDEKPCIACDSCELRLFEIHGYEGYNGLVKRWNARAAEFLSTSQPNRMGTTPEMQKMYDEFGGEVPRCEICDWPLASDQSKGCVPGDCSYRPDDPAEQERIRKRRAALAATPAVGGEWWFRDMLA